MIKIGDILHNRWEIIYIGYEQNTNRKCIQCKCIYCGNIKNSTEYLIKSVNHICEVCRDNKLKSYIGKKYNNITIIKILEKITNKNREVVCLCDCGKEFKSALNGVISGKYKSCGCARKGINFKHGLSNTRIYRIHSGMKKRCYNKNTSNYNIYGGRGIKVCEEWLNKETGFINFYNWSMNNGYNDELTIERIDVNGDYCPENCKWVTLQEQFYNKTNTVYVDIYNKKMTLRELSNIYNIDYISTRTKYYNNTLHNYIKNIDNERMIDFCTQLHNAKYNEEYYNIRTNNIMTDEQYYIQNNYIYSQQQLQNIIDTINYCKR